MLIKRILCSTRTYIGIAGVIFAIVIVLLILPAMWRNHQARMILGTRSNLKQIYVALDRYAADHDDQFPPLEIWQGLLVESGYLEAQALKSLFAPDDDNAFAFNAALKGMKFADVQEPDRFVLAFEVEPGSPQAGGIDDVAPEHYEGYGIMILFGDGRVESVDNSELVSLKWNLSGDD